MGHVSTSQPSSVLPSAAEVDVARALAARIAAGLDKGATMTLSVDGGEEVTSVPPVVARLVLDILGELARGHAVSISGIEAELSPEQAAALINIPRVAMVQLIGDGKIPFHQVGQEPRIKLEDALAFKADLYAQRETTLDELVAHDQALGLQ